MPARMNRREFRELVSRALEGLPEEFARALENVAVVIEEEPSAEDIASVGLDPEEDDLLGLYQGVPLPDRGTSYEALPDRIAIYRLPILWACENRAEIAAEVRTTVIHELGHYFGLPDSELPE